MYILLEDIEICHWRESIEELDCPVITQKRSWFLDQAKALFYKNLHLPSKDCFLDIGAGSGVISTELSKSFKEGVAFDHLPEAVRFMKKRVLQDMISNVQVVAGDGLKLPFCNEIFDLTILHGVLEWIASFKQGKNCRKVQRDFLMNNLRCLKKGGKIAIANLLGSVLLIKSRSAQISRPRIITSASPKSRIVCSASTS